MTPLSKILTLKPHKKLQFKASAAKNLLNIKKCHVKSRQMSSSRTVWISNIFSSYSWRHIKIYDLLITSFFSRFWNLINCFLFTRQKILLLINIFNYWIRVVIGSAFETRDQFFSSFHNNYQFTIIISYCWGRKVF